MRVRAIKDGDFTFGQSKMNYIDKEDAIKQNVITRIKSFKNDWFLDTEAVIGWWELLGNKGTETEILRQVEEAALNTYGVTSVTSLTIDVPDNRTANIELSYLTIYNNEITEDITL